MLNGIKLNEKDIVICSPTAKKSKVFGAVNYFPDELDESISQLIESVICSRQPGDMAEIVNHLKQQNNTIVIACTELSLLADRENISSRKNSLDIAIDIIIRRIKNG